MSVVLITNSREKLAASAAPRLDPICASLAPVVRRIPRLSDVLSDKPATNSLVELLRYVIVSAVALICDFGTLVALTEIAGLHYLVAAAIGFGIGVVVAYSLSVRWVFRRRRLAGAASERLVFVLIGIAGLALNQVILFGLSDMALLPYTVAKVCSVGVVFTFNFTLRKILLFTAAPKSEEAVDAAQ